MMGTTQPGSGGGLAAQGTPAAGAPDSTRPTVGDTVGFADDEGGEVQVTVAEVLDPFEEFDPGDPPSADTRFVLVTVAFENAGERPFDADPFALRLTDAAGFLWRPRSIDRVAAEIVLPDL